MPLFLDRVPFFVRPRRDGRALSPREDEQRLSVSLPILVTDPDVEIPPAPFRPQRWILDTGKEGEAQCWLCDLNNAGLDADAWIEGSTRVTSASGHSQRLEIRNATLWLCSNIPALRDHPFRLDLNRGIAFDRSKTVRHAADLPPLLGMELLRAARLRVWVDYHNRTVSIHTPGSTAESLSLFVRHALRGSRRLPLPWEPPTP